MTMTIDSITIVLIVIAIVILVFLLADYRIFKKFILEEKDRNISFTSQQVKDYIQAYSKTNKISEDFVEEFLKDIVRKDSVENLNVDENVE